MTQSPPVSPDSEQGKERTAAPTPEASDKPKRWQRFKFKRLLLLLIGLAIAGVGAGVAAWYFLLRSPSELIELSGRLEGYPTDIDARVAGEVESVGLREGDRVEPGEVVVQLDDAQLQAQLEGAEAQLAAAQQRVQQAQRQIQVVESQIREARLNQLQATDDAQGRIAEAEARVAQAEAELARAQARLEQSQSSLALARMERDRYRFLVTEGAVSQQRFDEAQTALETALATVRTQEAELAAARRQVSATQGILAQARSEGLNPAIRSTQIEQLQNQLDVAQAELAAVEAEAKNAQARRQEILARLDDLEINSPIGGIVITRTVEPGTVVTSGTTLLTVLDPNLVYMRGFIPEGQIGRVRVGQPARIYLDSFPDRPLTGRVRAIDTEASFTPENIYFKEDRVQQVFGVEIEIVDPGGFAKPGMPADAEILPQQEESDENDGSVPQE